MTEKYNIIGVAKDALAGTLDVADDATKQRRMAACRSCDKRNAALNVCTLCGCWLPGKTKFQKSTCPLGKW